MQVRERIREQVQIARRERLPRWASVPLTVAGTALAVAALGFYWDVAWHIDLGRDKTLFTPAHVLIVVGLLGVFASGLLATALYPQRPSRRAIHLAGRWVPSGGLFLLACGTAALAGFPLDDIWHRLFGKDVTLWGPTHLLMIAGASFAPLGLWMLASQAARESEANVRWRWHMARR